MSFISRIKDKKPTIASLDTENLTKYKFFMIKTFKKLGIEGNFFLSYKDNL